MQLAFHIGELDLSHAQDLHGRDWVAFWSGANDDDGDPYAEVRQRGVAGVGTVLVLPVADFSMPYNVCCFVLVVCITFALGGVSVMRSAARISQHHRQAISQSRTAHIQ